jgi:RNA polymerase sigma-70 factor (ECF subfamily)
VTTGALDEFQTHRGRLFGIAYRMLGSVAEAEDVLQEAWLRWNGTTDTVREPAAYLATIVTRLCLTALDSARARRETYIGPWLPEPVDTAADPLLGAERAEALSLAVLLLLERLSPAERAAYVLHEAFAYPFEQIAEMLETSAANARQLASRARTRITQERGRTVSPADRDRLLGAFVAAAQSGDLAALEAVLTADAVTFSDGGGVVSAARKPVMGREKVAAFLLGVLEKFASDLVPMPVLANGEPAFVGLRDGVPEALCSVDITEQGVARVLIVLNPQKLSQFAGLSGRSS